MTTKRSRPDAHNTEAAKTPRAGQAPKAKTSEARLRRRGDSLVVECGCGAAQIIDTEHYAYVVVVTDARDRSRRRPYLTLQAASALMDRAKGRGDEVVIEICELWRVERAAR